MVVQLYLSSSRINVDIFVSTFFTYKHRLFEDLIQQSRKVWPKQTYLDTCSNREQREIWILASLIHDHLLLFQRSICFEFISFLCKDKFTFFFYFCMLWIDEYEATVCYFFVCYLKLSCHPYPNLVHWEARTAQRNHVFHIFL